MTKIIFFKPRDEWIAEKKLNEFIKMAKNELTMFGADLNWNDNYWPEAGVTFAKFDVRTPSGNQPTSPLDMPYLDFAKAYLRYTQSHKPTVGKAMSGVKALEAALFQATGTSNLQDVTHGTFDDAQQLAVNAISRDSAVNCGSELGKLAGFLTKYQLIPTAISWKTSLKKGNSKVRTGKKAQEIREKKLPNTEALDALGDIFSSEPTFPRDILTTCVVAMLMCAPSRISEILSLRADCEVYEDDKNGIEQYGWRFQPGKGGISEIKWIPVTMVEVAKAAISRMTTFTEEARKLAKFYESNKTDLYQYDGCLNFTSEEYLTWEQAANIIGSECSKDNKRYKECKDKTKFAESYSRSLFQQMGFDVSKLPSKRSIRQFINKKAMPKNFPWYDQERKIKYSEALFCTSFNQFNHSKPTSPIKLANPITRQQFNHDIVSGAGNPHCIFDRYDVLSSDGKALKLTSHQFRHLLNTMAQRGGLAQYDIARWSGRADMQQNDDYDQMSEFELVEMLEDANSGLTLYGPDTEIATKMPMTRQEFNALIIPTAHVTELGFCIHDWTMEPCPKFRDCINCTEQVCIKGDKRKARLKEVYEDTLNEREKADKAIKEGFYGADRHYEHQIASEKRLKELLGIMNNPSIPDGSIIRLRNDKEFSPLKNAVQAKIERTPVEENNEMLTDLMDLFGDQDG
jgi:hypothetical protein